MRGGRRAVAERSRAVGGQSAVNRRSIAERSQISRRSIGGQSLNGYRSISGQSAANIQVILREIEWSKLNLIVRCLFN